MDLAFQMTAVLAVLAGLFVTVRLLARRSLLPARKVPGLLSVEARLPLTAQHQLHLVHWGGKQLLVATYPGGCATLADPSSATPSSEPNQSILPAAMAHKANLGVGA